MRLQHPLDDLLADSSHVRVLRVMHALPKGAAVSAREAAQRSGLSHPTTGRVLWDLVEQGVVNVRYAPRAHLFSVNMEHDTCAIVGQAFAWERGLRDRVFDYLRDAIDASGLPIHAALVFGSAARGDMRAESDLDLAVTCSPGDEASVLDGLMDVADDVRARFGLRLQPVVQGQSVERLARSRKGMWPSAVAEGIPVYGAISS